MKNPDRKLIGSAWKKEGKYGEYLSISFNKEELAQIDTDECWVEMTLNDRKTKPTSPDYFMFAKPKQKQKPQGPRQSVNFPSPQVSRPTIKPKPYKNGSSSSSMPEPPQGWDDPEDPGF